MTDNQQRAARYCLNCTPDAAYPERAHSPDQCPWIPVADPAILAAEERGRAKYDDELKGALLRVQHEEERLREMVSRFRALVADAAPAEQTVDDADTLGDGWEDYTSERTRLANFLRDRNAAPATLCYCDADIMPPHPRPCVVADAAPAGQDETGQPDWQRVGAESAEEYAEYQDWVRRGRPRDAEGRPT